MDRPETRYASIAAADSDTDGHCRGRPESQEPADDDWMPFLRMGGCGVVTRSPPPPACLAAQPSQYARPMQRFAHASVLAILTKAMTPSRQTSRSYVLGQTGMTSGYCASIRRDLRATSDPGPAPHTTYCMSEQNGRQRTAQDRWKRLSRELRPSGSVDSRPMSQPAFNRFDSTTPGSQAIHCLFVLGDESHATPARHARTM